MAFASRPGSDSRSLLNEAELLTECNKWTPNTAAATAAAAAPGRRRRQLLEMLGNHRKGSKQIVNSTLGKLKGAECRGGSTRSLLAAPGGGDEKWTWVSANCVARRFGSSPGGMLADLGFMSDVDVLVCIHGAACLNGFFMPNGSSLVRGDGDGEKYLSNVILHFPQTLPSATPAAVQIEIRPLGMSTGWANRYFLQPLENERSIQWCVGLIKR